MDIVEYKGFELVPAPYQLAETSEWAVRVTITRHHDVRGQSLEKTCIAQNRADTLEEAKYLAIQFGTGIIDGKHPDVSLDDLF
ncbi:CV_2116 domain-containing protein [Marinobacter koreensis]|uniref:CV_2116 domain-containing protein n=1 Tax=Marinobacter koreensis TaxID=335974 RepID=A0ABW0RJX9_9GAMM|nr:hypothetical protein [Marinobacter koreensis]MCK7548444.1 hypothetical protein [Marinobacter koreensis]